MMPVGGPADAARDWLEAEVAAKRLSPELGAPQLVAVARVLGRRAEEGEGAPRRRRPRGPAPQAALR